MRVSSDLTDINKSVSYVSYLSELFIRVNSHIYKGYWDINARQCAQHRAIHHTYLSWGNGAVQYNEIELYESRIRISLQPSYHVCTSFLFVTWWQSIVGASVMYHSKSITGRFHPQQYNTCLTNPVFGSKVESLPWKLLHSN